MTPAPRIGSLCTGYGGLDIAVRQVLSGALAWHADNDPGAAAILTHHHPAVPNLGDITRTNWHQVEPVDVLTAGYPCQPFSTAGKRKGTADARHIWPYIADALGVLRPSYAVFENVAGHLRLGFDTVLADLARLGFDAEWCTVRASEVGAPHRRERLFIVATPADTADLGHERGWPARGRRPGPANGRVAAADTSCQGLPIGKVQHHGPERPAAERSGREPAPDTDGPGGQAWRGRSGAGDARRSQPWGQFAPAIARWERVTGSRAPWATDDRGRLSPEFVEWLMGLPAGHVTAVPGLTRTAQLKALGNGVVPQQAAAALRLLLDRLAPAQPAA